MTTIGTLRQPGSKLATAIEEFVRRDIDLAGSGAREFPSEPVWGGLAAAGTEIWLDTGDIEGAAALWRAEMTALTTNNTLLYNEVKKGIYDDLAAEAAAILRDGLDGRAAVVEVAFILNARHGLRLVERFGARVSVELHTDLAHDIEGTLAYARRYHRISPDRFIVKIPFTPAGLIATRELRREGIPINMTLGFSARQNHLAAVFAAPEFLNVFLGRLNAYVADNRLGSGDLVGEKATLASQRTLGEVNARPGRSSAVRQIAASMRSADQVPALAGVDVHTMPLKVAAGVLEDPPSSWSSRIEDDPEPGIDGGPVTDAARLETLWEVDAAVDELARSLDAEPPATPGELVERTHAAGLGDLFPRLSTDELARIEADGKIPVHAAWSVASGELAVDSLLNAAGLASFAGDQRALDERVRGLIGR